MSTATIPRFAAYCYDEEWAPGHRHPRWGVREQTISANGTTRYCRHFTQCFGEADARAEADRLNAEWAAV